ncbi:MAG: hypothetical protein HGA53_04000 [Anaerolineaceae bacterium]|nr:hypothetical protein [Anaerolineaceae bacterium]NTV36095.1 hypothetical protein [Anaerolineaceae bacterium]
MSDLFDRVTQGQDIFKKLLGKIPGFKGYVERNNRRSSDKILRDAIADRFEEQYQRISGVQRDLISQGQIELIDDLESAAIKLRQFIDRVRNASYGYAGIFDAIKIEEAQLAAVYSYDLALLNASDEVSRAVDNLESSVGTDGMPAAIRHLVALSKQAVDAYNRRSEVMIGGVEGSPSAGDSMPPTVPPTSVP